LHLSLVRGGGGHPIILGRPWLATIDDLIGCRPGEITISNGHYVKNITLHPLDQPIVENILWLEDLYANDNEEVVHLVLTIEQAMKLKYNTA